MKKVTSTWILAALVAASCNQKEPAEKTILGMGTDYYSIPETLNGKVKSVRETNYWAVEKDGKYIKGDQMTWKDLDSVRSTKDFMAYFDENGAMWQYDHFDVNDVIHDSSVGTGENGRYTSWDYKVQGNNVSHINVSYDNLGYITGAERYNMNDSLLRRQVLTHDGKGNYTKNEFFDPNGQKLYYQVFTLDDRGKVMKSEVYNDKDSLLFRSVNTYDGSGMISKMNSDNSTWDFEYLKFDKNGNWLELVSNIDGKFRMFSERQYEYY